MKISALANLRNKRIYSIEGNIGAGKTTLLKLIGKSMNDIEFVEEPLSNWEDLNGHSLLKCFYENPIRWGYSFESYSMYSKVEALIKAAKTDKPIIMVERSLLSNKVFFDISSGLGKLDAMEYQMLLTNYDFYTSHLYPKLSGIIYLRTPLEECVKRIKKRSRSGEEEIDRGYLKLLDEKFSDFCDNSKIPKLDISETYDINNPSAIIKKIDEFMHPKDEQEDKENSRIN